MLYSMTIENVQDMVTAQKMMCEKAVKWKYLIHWIVPFKMIFENEVQDKKTV